MLKENLLELYEQRNSHERTRARWQCAPKPPWSVSMMTCIRALMAVDVMTDR